MVATEWRRQQNTIHWFLCQPRRSSRAHRWRCRCRGVESAAQWRAQQVLAKLVATTFNKTHRFRTVAYSNGQMSHAQRRGFRMHLALSHTRRCVVALKLGAHIRFRSVWPRRGDRSLQKTQLAHSTFSIIMGALLTDTCDTRERTYTQLGHNVCANVLIRLTRFAVRVCLCVFVLVACFAYKSQRRQTYCVRSILFSREAYISISTHTHTLARNFRNFTHITQCWRRYNSGYSRDQAYTRTTTAKQTANEQQHQARKAHTRRVRADEQMYVYRLTDLSRSRPTTESAAAATAAA